MLGVIQAQQESSEWEREYRQIAVCSHQRTLAFT